MYSCLIHISKKTVKSPRLKISSGLKETEAPAVGALVVEESNGEPDEIVPVSGHQTSFFSCCKVELSLIRRFTHSGLLSACKAQLASRRLCLSSAYLKQPTT
jgi:hypothetical protein